jgi:hypothetical protein
MSRRSPHTHTHRLWLSLAFLLCCAHAAHAATQTYVSAAGDDSNPCDRVSPCRTFAGALAKTNNRGELAVLDSGEYGAFTVNFSVKITAVGVYAGVTVFDPDAVTINPAAGSETVRYASRTRPSPTTRSGFRISSSSVRAPSATSSRSATRRTRSASPALTPCNISRRRSAATLSAPM